MKFGVGFGPGVIRPRRAIASRVDDDFQQPNDTPLEETPGWEQEPTHPGQTGDLKIVGNAVAQARLLANRVAYRNPNAGGGRRKAKAKIIESGQTQGYISPAIIDAENFAGTQYIHGTGILKAVKVVSGVLTVLGEILPGVIAGTSSIGGIIFDGDYYITLNDVAVAGPFSLGGSLSSGTFSGLVAVGAVTSAWLDDFISEIVTAVNAVAPIAPANTVLPVISGTAQADEILSVTTGTWSNGPTGFTYQWRRGGSNIGGATASTYTLVVGDVAANIDCIVTATNAGGSTGATAAAVGPIIAAYPSATRWRLYITEPFGSTTGRTVAVRELSLLNSTGASISTSGATFSAHAFWDASQNAAKAFDGNTTTTQWAGRTDTNANVGWLECQFATAKQVLGFTMVPYGTDNSVPKTYKLQYYDGSVWVDWIVVPTLDAVLNNGVTRTYRKNATRVWRMNITGNDGAVSASVAIAELQFRSVVGVGETPSGGWSGTNGQWGGAEIHQAAFDANDATYWGNWITNPKTLYYTFQSRKVLAQLYVKSRASNPTQAPSAFTVDYSDDFGNSWTTVLTVTGSTGWTDGQARTYNV